MYPTKGLIFVISAPSGCGKTSLIKALLRRRKNLAHPVSFTTRLRRDGERNSRDYNFISKDEFERRLKKGDFLEWSRPFGRFYGTPKGEIFKAIEKGRDVILNLDVNGGFFVKENFKEAVLIYLLPPSLKALRSRLIGRSTDAKDEISKRLKIAKKDMLNLHRYDYAVVNDDFTVALKELQAILIAERLKVR